MGIEFVGYAEDQVGDPAGPCSIPRPAGIAADDILIAITRGTGGSGAWATGIASVDEVDVWGTTTVGVSGGYIGNQFDTASLLFARTDGSSSSPLLVRNFTGGGAMLAYRGIEYFTLDGGTQTADEEHGSTSGTLHLDSYANGITEGQGIAFYIAWDFYISNTAGVSFTWPAGFNVRGTFFQDSTHFEIADVIQSVGADWPAIDLPYSGTCTNVTLRRLIPTYSSTFEPPLP
jgi:hypothetical protein